MHARDRGRTSNIEHGRRTGHCIFSTMTLHRGRSAISSEFVPVAHRDAAARAVNAPANPSVLLVADVLEVEEDLRPLAEANRAAHADQSVAGEVWIERDGRVVVDD